MDALRLRRRLGTAVVLLWASFAAAQGRPAPPRAASTRESPDSYGTGPRDYSVTVIPATAFTSDDHYVTDYGSLARFFPISDQYPRYRAGVSIPSGVVIDYVGLECSSAANDELTVRLFLNNRYGGGPVIATLGNTPHGFATDYTGRLDWRFERNVHNALWLDVEQAGNTQPLFGWVEIWWKRRVSPAPATATFADVPTTHPFFQFVEALNAAGITNGYPDGRFGVNDPITRGQMAVFLSTALGLQWSNY